MNRKLIISIVLSIVYCISVAQVNDNYRSLLKDDCVKLDKTNLPIIFINVDGQMILRDYYILAQMVIIYNGEGEYNYGDTIQHPNQHIDYKGYIALKYRGHSSFYNSDKKPYGFKTLETAKLPKEGGEKKNVSLLGMANDSKWAMLAPWVDRSMIRDILSFDLARPWMDFVPETRLCEVILDGIYYGVYILTEHVSQGKNRLNLKNSGEINNGGETDILIYIDRGNDPYYESKYHPYGKDGQNIDRYIKYEYKFPDNNDFSTLPEGTQNYVDSEINRMEETFLSANYDGPINGYGNTIDILSFIDYMLTTEISYNVDGYRLSTYMYKYSDKRSLQEGLDNRWKMSLWDFNMAWGNTIYYDHASFVGWNYDINNRDDFQNDNDWVPFYWRKLLHDQEYVEKMQKRWKQYRGANYSTESIYSKIDSITTLINICDAGMRNEKAWQIFNSDIWGVGYHVSTYEEEISYLKNWIKGRLEYMDVHICSNSTGLKELYNGHENTQFYNLNGQQLTNKPKQGIFIGFDKGRAVKMFNNR